MLSEALLQALREVWHALQKLDAPKAIVGGRTMAIWRRPRATHDIDILIGVAPDHIDELISLMRGLGARLKREPIELSGVTLVQVLYSPADSFIDVQVDLLVAKSEYHRQALLRAGTDVLFGTDLTINYVACEDLILLKLLAGRAIDEVDAEVLLNANVDSLDIEYLIRWARELHVDLQLKKAWFKALPDRPFPARPGGSSLR